MKKHVLNKKTIGELAEEVYDYLDTNGLIDDTCIYFNHKRVIRYNHIPKTEEGLHPREYCEYSSKNNILTITSEGPLYDIYNYINYELPAGLRKILHKYGLYMEAATSWCWSAYLEYDESEYEIEYDTYDVPDPIWIYRNGPAPEPIKNIMNIWYDLSAKTGDIGACVIGAYMHFKYNDVVYEMAPSSPWQGEGSWTAHVNTIKKLLDGIGATEIYWNCGVLD